MDAESITKRAKLAKRELALCGEFIEQERQRLYEAFASSMPADDLYEIHSQARALTSLESFLTNLVNSERFISLQKENQYV